MSAELLAVAEEAARAAGALVLERLGAGGAGSVQTKSSPTDMVSEADVAAEQAIRAVLAHRRPDDGILGEEGDSVAGTTGLRWVVDPIDGTTNFVYGNPQWCVSVACEGVVGVVLDPVRNELFAVDLEGDGAPTLDGRAIARSPGPASLATALVATGFGYEAAVRERQAVVASRVLPRVRDLRRAGAAALDLAWAAAGRVDAYWERGVKPWDVAAGRLLCAGAGLDVVELAATDADAWGLLVAPPSISAELVALVAG